MDVQDLGYALTQVVHNLGAVSVTGGAAALRFLRFAEPLPTQRRLTGLVLAGWTAQGASGIAFGAISYAGYGRLPDIHGIAVAALLLKMACAVAGFMLAAVCLVRAPGWAEPRRQHASLALFVISLTALTAAALLRWFS